jgi:hypothetical protein
MKRLCLLVATVLITGNMMAQKKGWVPLFDGKTLAGWHLFKKPAETPAWTVKDGSIYLDPAIKEGRGDLVTDNEFGDFEFKFEWKVGAKSNSGVILFVQENEKFGATWHSGPEFQLIDNTGYPDPLKPGQMAASLYDLIPCDPALIKPTGEWNSTLISLKKGKLEFTVNGKKAVSVVVGGDEWNSLVAKSKFADMKGFAKNTKGRIALQHHNGEVWFRNLMIKSL